MQQQSRAAKATVGIATHSLQLQGQSSCRCLQAVSNNHSERTSLAHITPHMLIANTNSINAAARTGSDQLGMTLGKLVVTQRCDQDNLRGTTCKRTSSPELKGQSHTRRLLCVFSLCERYPDDEPFVHRVKAVNLARVCHTSEMSHVEMSKAPDFSLFLHLVPFQIVFKLQSRSQVQNAICPSAQRTCILLGESKERPRESLAKPRLRQKSQ